MINVKIKETMKQVVPLNYGLKVIKGLNVYKFSDIIIICHTTFLYSTIFMSWPFSLNIELTYMFCFLYRRHYPNRYYILTTKLRPLIIKLLIKNNLLTSLLIKLNSTSSPHSFSLVFKLH